MNIKDRLNIRQKYNKQKKNAINKDDMHQCYYCPAEFSTQAGMFRHQTSCKNNELMQLRQQMEQQKIENDLKLQMLELKLENKELSFKLENKDEIIKSKDVTIEILKNQSVTTDAITSIAKKSVSALTYLATKHKNAPPLKQVKYEDAKELLMCDKDNDLTNKILGKYQIGRLDEFIGDIIVGFYKKTDPSKQSIWNSDAPRLTFLIKDIVGEKSEWITDKKGMKLRELVIRPINILIEKLVKDWQVEQENIDVDDLDREQIDERMQNTTNAIGVLKGISSNKLEEDISKNLSPRFGLNKN